MADCPTCGAEHALLDPAFQRPDEVWELPEAEREDRVLESDDLCVLRGEGDSQEGRFFVRGLLWVDIQGNAGGCAWGLWAEVEEEAFHRIRELWDDPRQGRERPFPARLANQLPGYPPTRGLPVRLALVDPSTRPSLMIVDEVEHPFFEEVRRGVTPHRVSQWLAAMEAD